MNPLYITAIGMMFLLVIFAIVLIQMVIKKIAGGDKRGGDRP
jgi:hypothetical protein